MSQIPAIGQDEPVSGDFLAAMAAASRARCELARAAIPDEEQGRRARSAPPPAVLRWSDHGFDVIAEIKLHSPSAGELATAPDAGAIVQRARTYAEHGAAAVSILTEPRRFAGDLAHLESGAHALQEAGVPAMRKDFLVDPYQVLEARASGAGGVLLILAILDDQTLGACIEVAAELGMFVLLEAFDADELARAAHWQARHVINGLNCRDLRTLEVDETRFERLAGRFPPGPRVAESGVASDRDAQHIAGLGYTAALVGSALMTAPQPGRLLGSLLRAGRAAARGEAG